MDKTEYTLAWIQIPRPVPTCKEAIASSELRDSTRAHPTHPQPGLGAPSAGVSVVIAGKPVCTGASGRVLEGLCQWFLSCVCSSLRARVCVSACVCVCVCASWLPLCVEPSGLKGQTDPTPRWKKVSLAVQGIPWATVRELGDSWCVSGGGGGGAGVGQAG